MPENRKYLQATGKPPTVSYMLAFDLKLIFQIIFQTMFLFMILWMTLFHERWENFRYYMNRNYFPKSAAFMCGFLILFAYFLTTSGKGFEWTSDRALEGYFLSRYLRVKKYRLKNYFWYNFLTIFSYLFFKNKNVRKQLVATGKYFF